MSEQDFKTVVEDISRVIDATGVLVILIGLLIATIGLITAQRTREDRTGSYRLCRQQIGKAILLGLEFLVAADIIRTVAVDPSFRSVGTLAIIVAVRTFLSFTLDVELEGHWPWQQRSSPPPPGSPAS